jgi:hypothetical protein
VSSGLQCTSPAAARPPCRPGDQGQLCFEGLSRGSVPPSDGVWCYRDGADVPPHACGHSSLAENSSNCELDVIASACRVCTRGLYSS